MTDAGGVSKFVREYTLASGGPYCDCGYKKEISTETEVTDMQIDLSNQLLPPVYRRKGHKCYLDPIREQLIKITPEETVRQQTIAFLLNELEVPKAMIKVEEHLSHYGIKSKRRADIIVEKYVEADEAIKPLLVIECKAPSVMLGENQINQVLDYADAIASEYVMVINGFDAICAYFDEEKNVYIDIEKLPDYIDMLKGKFVSAPEIVPPKRFCLEEITKDDNWRAYHDSDMGRDTGREISIAAVNFWEALIYTDHQLPKKKYDLFELIDDYGVRILNYGNASGGQFFGGYRSFLIDFNGNTEFVSLGMSQYVTSAHQDIAKTTLNVAIDNEKACHHSLQLVLDDNLYVSGDEYTFYHHGRIGISNKGSGRVSELRELVREYYPKIIDGNKFNLGKLKNDHLWNLDEDDMNAVVENLISYALIRDVYRERKKSQTEA